MRCRRTLPDNSYLEHIANQEGRKRIRDAIDFHNDHIIMVKKLKRYGHISGSSGMPTTILQSIT